MHGHDSRHRRADRTRGSRGLDVPYQRPQRREPFVIRHLRASISLRAKRCCRWASFQNTANNDQKQQQQHLLRTPRLTPRCPRVPRASTAPALSTAVPACSHGPYCTLRTFTLPFRPDRDLCRCLAFERHVAWGRCCCRHRQWSVLFIIKCQMEECHDGMIQRHHLSSY